MPAVAACFGSVSGASRPDRVAAKGSICVDGVSLTVNRVSGDEFEVNLIPHTLKVTTLARLEPGAKVNLEVDLIARYVERMLSTSLSEPNPGA